MGHSLTTLRWFEGVVMDWSLFVFGCWRTEGKQVWKWIGLCKVDTIKECPDQTCVCVANVVGHQVYQVHTQVDMLEVLLHRCHTDDLPPCSHFSGLYDSCDVSFLSRSFPIEVTQHIITLYYYIFSQPCKLEQCLCRCQSHVHIHNTLTEKTISHSSKMQRGSHFRPAGNLLRVSIDSSQSEHRTGRRHM